MTFHKLILTYKFHLADTIHTNVICIFKQYGYYAERISLQSNYRTALSAAFARVLALVPQVVPDT